MTRRLKGYDWLAIVASVGFVLWLAVMVWLIWTMEPTGPGSNPVGGRFV